MIGKLIEICGKNRLIVFIVTGLVLLWSVWTINKTPIDALPDLSDMSEYDDVIVQLHEQIDKANRTLSGIEKPKE